MATIHSLPFELIRHTLSLAYPPGRAGSGRGLCSTALVHSSWKEPSVSVMTERVSFDGAPGVSARLLIEHGPGETTCQSLRLSRCSDEQTRAVLSRVRPNTVNRLAIVTTAGTLLPDLFGFACLSCKS